MSEQKQKKWKRKEPRVASLDLVDPECGGGSPRHPFYLPSMCGANNGVVRQFCLQEGRLSVGQDSGVEGGRVHARARIEHGRNVCVVWS